MGADVANDAVNEQRESCLDHALTLSFGRSATDNRPTARTLRFGDLIREFSEPDTARGTLSAAEYHALDKSDRVQKVQRDLQKDGPYFVGCGFGGDGRRCNDNVEELCGMALDFDSGKTTKEDIRRLLEGYAYAAYTSYSHQAELEKWRVFIPYREPIRACIVLFVDEAFWAGDKQGEAVLKCYITEAKLPVEHKGRDVERVPNLLHVIMASNSEWVVPAGLDERRFLVLDVDHAVQQNTSYFRGVKRRDRKWRT